MEISKLAKLARIKLTKEEEKELSREFEDILAYVDQIKAAKIEHEGQDLVGKTDQINIMREDSESNTRGEMTEKLLDLAPKKHGRYIEVKKIL